MFRFLIIILSFSFTALNAFPVLDLDHLNSDDEKRELFIAELSEALGTYGFVLIQNHGINESTIDQALLEAKLFFSLPLKNKKEYEGVRLNRGYKSYDSKRSDKKATFKNTGMWVLRSMGIYGQLIRMILKRGF